MINTKSKTYSLSAIIIFLFLPFNLMAQTDSFTSGPSDGCPSEFKSDAGLKVCGTKGFDKPSFKRKRANTDCGNTYLQLGHSQLCVLDTKLTRIKYHNDRLMVTKAKKKACGKNFIRLPNHKACVHKRVGLTLVDSQVSFQQTRKLECNSKNPESDSCKIKCAPGFFRSPEIGLCVDYHSVLNSTKRLSNKKCKNPKHWKKLDNSGICVPKMILSLEQNSTGGFELRPNEDTLSVCEDGAEIQITSLVLSPATEDENQPPASSDLNLTSNIQPVMFCMVRPRPPK
ncbi:hypothetical protein [Arenicella sp. 4NH20-0111]|uniref:hypothetical protein n=1 Tax=Arenicella sp. 4NH20-0111 TaxID=3127648 RepID=UPI003341EBEF